MDFLRHDGGMKTLAQLRLVSKAYNGYVKNYPGAINCTPSATALRRACQIMPNKSSISITAGRHKEIDLSPLTNCTFLTSIDISALSAVTPGYTQPLQLCQLPARITFIRLEGVYITELSFKNIRAANAKLITHFTCSKWADKAKPSWDWLDCLPNLQAKPLSFNRRKYMQAQHIDRLL